MSSIDFASIRDLIEARLPLPALVKKGCVKGLTLKTHEEKYRTSRLYRRLANTLEAMALMPPNEPETFKPVRNKLVWFFRACDINLPYAELVEVINSIQTTYSVGTLLKISSSELPIHADAYDEWTKWKWSDLSLADFPDDAATIAHVCGSTVPAPTAQTPAPVTPAPASDNNNVVRRPETPSLRVL